VVVLDVVCLNPVLSQLLDSSFTGLLVSDLDEPMEQMAEPDQVILMHACMHIKYIVHFQDK